MTFIRSTAIGLRLYKAHVGPATIASREIVRELMQEAASAVAATSSAMHFLLTEWEQVVDAWQLESWEAYRDVARLGRKTRLPEAAAEGVVVDLRAGSRWLEARRLDHLQPSCSARWQPPSPRARTCRSISRSWTRRRTSASTHLRFFAALGGRSTQRALLRRRPRPAHLPAAVLVEGPRRRYPRTLPHAARQLPHLAPNPHPGGPAARPRGDGRGRQQ